MFFQRRRFSRRFAQPLKRHIYEVYVCQINLTLSERRINAWFFEGSTFLCGIKPDPYFYSLPSFFVRKFFRLCISYLQHLFLAWKKTMSFHTGRFLAKIFYEKVHYFQAFRLSNIILRTKFQSSIILFVA